METLIIYAHPNKDGHCGEILKNVLQQSKNFELLDLYALHYDPVLQPNEHYTSGHYALSKQTKEFQEKITKATKLIFIYPLWWGGMPAILKGFFDRVFTSKFAFQYVDGKPIGLLSGKKAVAFVPTGGPGWVYKYVFLGMVGRIFTLLTMKFCGISSRIYHIHGASRLNEKNKIKIQTVVSKGIQWLYG